MSDVRRRGMRDVATLRTRADQTAPATRAQAVSRFAKLENEKVRLLRELGTWDARKGVTERMLAIVEVELAALKHALLGEAPAPKARRTQDPPNSREPRQASAGAPHVETMIEY